jgi:hypothetical protein
VQYKVQGFPNISPHLARVDIGVSTRNHISRQVVLVHVRMCYRENAPALIINGREIYEVRHVESSIGRFDTRTSAWYRSNCPVPHSTALLFLRIQSVAKYLGAFRTQGSASQIHSRPRSRLRVQQRTCSVHVTIVDKDPLELFPIWFV